MNLITFNKTTELINMAHDKNILIVCFNRKEVAIVFKRAGDMERNILYPITIREFIEGRYHANHIDEILIDNIDMCMKSLSKVPLRTMTLTPSVL